MKLQLNTRQFRLFLLGLLGFAIILFITVGWLGLSMLGAKSQKMVDLKLQSKTLDTQLSNLTQAKKQIEKYSYFQSVAKTVIPSDKDQAQALLDINQLASQAGIVIQSISFPTSTLGVQPSGSSGTTSSSSTQPSSVQKLISQAKPVSGISGLYSIELTITPASGGIVSQSQQPTYPKLLDFMDRVEKDRRTAQITRVTVQPMPNFVGSDQIVNFTLSINIFIKP